MLIKSLKLKNFKCFENYSITFEKLNLLEGAIGIGKSTLIEAVVFVLYGFYEGLLSDLPTKEKATSCSVTVIIEDKSDIIEIIREYPLKLQIKENNNILKISTADGNKYLEERFGIRLTFNQFRKIDAYNPESNFLAQGDTALKRILFAGTDTLFNDVRNNLNKILGEREKYNRDTAVIYKHYPSEKRLAILKNGYTKLCEQYAEMENEIGSIEDGINKKSSQLSRNESRIESNKSTIERLQKQIDNVDTIKSSYETKLIQAQSRHAEIQRSVDDLNKQIENVDSIKSSYDEKILKAENRIDLNNRNINTLNEELEFAKSQTDVSINNNICYVCKQSIETKKADEIKKEIETIRTKKRTLIKSYKREIKNTLEIDIPIFKNARTQERLQKVEDIKKNLENIINEDIELCHQIPEYYEAIKKERLQKAEEFKTEINGLSQEIISLEEQNATLKDDIDIEKDLKETYLTSRKMLQEDKENIQKFIMILDGRLKQKEYIYTERDVIIVKKAIEELDKLSSIYLVETVHSLEPIINSVLEKIGFAITFDVDIKGKFKILLNKGDIQYKYTDLSCGQRLILQIALKLALLLQKGESGLMFSDEGLSALENNNLEDIINLFKELPFQLVFVLHRANIEDNEINIIRLGEANE
jgi:DNA repair exonuclease SbcCD ATPase subunit